MCRGKKGRDYLFAEISVRELVKLFKVFIKIDFFFGFIVLCFA